MILSVSLTDLTRKIVLVAFLCLILLTKAETQKSSGYKLIEKPKDVKEFKKLLRTKTNVLVLFARKGEATPAAKKWIPLLSEAANTAFGKGTIATVDCSTDEGRKLCKKFKVPADPVALKHYHNGEYHKDYDRLSTSESVVKFLLDPTGDIPWEEDFTAKDVLHVQDGSSLNKLLKKEKLPVLMMFYAPWCGFCKRLKPDFAAAATELKGKGVLAAMDVNRPENADVQDLYNITGFPTLLYFELGKYKFHYGGENNREGLLKWMKDPHPPKEEEPEQTWADEPSDVVHLKDGSFHQFVAENPSVLVMFYAPWCGHCKAMKPDYVTAASQLREAGVSGVLAAVDATAEQNLATEFDIKGFPMVKYYMNGKFAWDFPERSVEKIVEFMMDPKEPPPPPPPELAWKDTPGDVVHLTSETFKQELKRKKHALVMFYAPWCGHCKAAKPEFSGAAMSFKEEGRILFGAVDCTVDEELCTEHDVQGFPTITYFSYLKYAEQYSGSRTKADFETFMSKMAAIPVPGSQQETEKVVEQPAPLAEKPKDDWDPAVKMLTPENFDPELSKVTKAVVMFFAPWCGHCKKAKPEFSLAALALKEDSSKMLAALDCTAHKEFCKEKEVKGYPTFKIYENGKFARAYIGGRSKDDFIAAFSPEKVRKAPEPPAPTKDAFWPPGMTILHPENFEQSLKPVKRSLVMFYAPWCGHCKRAKPEFAAAADAARGQEGKLLAALDCTAYSGFCQDRGVQGYPTFHHFENGKFLGKYTGGRTKDAFIAGLSAEVKPTEAPSTAAPKKEPDWSPAVKILTPQNFETVLGDVKTAMVMFFAPWCGHCKKAKPEFSEAANSLKNDDTKAFAALDCTAHKEFCQGNGVNGFPTFQIFENGKFVRGYSGGRTKEAFIAGISLSEKTEL